DILLCGANAWTRFTCSPRVSKFCSRYWSREEFGMRLRSHFVLPPGNRARARQISRSRCNTSPCLESCLVTHFLDKGSNEDLPRYVVPSQQGRAQRIRVPHCE